MMILDFLKKIKLPKFEDDFIQDHAEKAMEEAPVSYGRRVVYDPRKARDIKTSRENLREWMDDSERNTDPADPASGELWTNG